MMTKEIGEQLPLLTSAISLPMLRVHPGDPHNRPVTAWWAGLLWVIVIIGPAAITIWSCRAGESAEIVAWWVGAMSVYLSLAVLVASVIIIGLVLPFACL